jgi:hypothetical protein
MAVTVASLLLMVATLASLLSPMASTLERMASSVMEALVAKLAVMMPVASKSDHGVASLLC